MPSPQLQTALQTLTIVGVALSLLELFLLFSRYFFSSELSHFTEKCFILHACLAIHFI